MPLNSVPNQRMITVHKELTDRQHLYTANNLEAIDEAAHYMRSKAGFKLYFYIAKNQNNYQFALSSSDFCNWANVGIAAYRSAFDELIQNGYLVPKDKEDKECKVFTFYDKSTLDLPMIHNEKTIIEYASNDCVDIK